VPGGWSWGGTLAGVENCAETPRQNMSPPVFDPPPAWRGLSAMAGGEGCSVTLRCRAKVSATPSQRREVRRCTCRIVLRRVGAPQPQLWTELWTPDRAPPNALNLLDSWRRGWDPQILRHKILTLCVFLPTPAALCIKICVKLASAVGSIPRASVEPLPQCSHFGSKKQLLPLWGRARSTP